MAKHCTASFPAQGEDGRSYSVEVWTDEASGVQSLRTSTGMILKRLNKGQYQIVTTKVVLRSTDPQAP
jgi:hypothetical protein